MLFCLCFFCIVIDFKILVIINSYLSFFFRVDGVCRYVVVVLFDLEVIIRRNELDICILVFCVWIKWKRFEENVVFMEYFKI